MAGNPNQVQNNNKKNKNNNGLLSGAPKDLAALYLQEWQDYKTKFGPLEDLRNTQLSDASDIAERKVLVGDVNSSYAKLPGQYSRQLMGYGAPATADQLKSFTKKANTQQGLDRVTAYNRGVLSEEDRRYGALSSFSSPSSTLSQIGAV